MLNLKQDIIRQLNTIYKMSFKYKYKEEIKERILFFVDKKYNKLSLLELKNIKKEIILIDNEIKEIKEDFFNKYKEDLLNSLNPLWYEIKENHIPIYHEKEFYKATILKECLEKVEIEIKEKYHKNLISLYGQRYNYSIRMQFHNFIERNTDNLYIFKERKNELNQLKKEIEENIKLYKGNAIIEKREELIRFNENNLTEQELRFDTSGLTEQDISKINKSLIDIEEQETDFFIKNIPDRIKCTNSAFEYLYCYLILKEINKRLEKY